ncbi:MAG: hypothetical protein OXE52_15015 [Chloroflexi bacterium]|nr:hypothetical protein [Chloroflexota bacterium]
MRLLTILILEVLNPLFAISFALFVSVGYIFTLLMPVTIELWQALLIPCTLIPFAWLLAGAVKRSKQSQSDACRFSWRGFLPLVIPILVLAPGLYAIASSPTVQILSHPDLHFGYINQLLYGSTPLENVFVAGFPANYYWLFHAYLAALTEATALRAPYVASTVNVLSVISSFLWIGQILVLLKLGKPRTLSLGLLVVFVFCSANMTGILSLFTHVVNGTFAPDNLRLLVLDGGHKHLHSSLNKLANINSMDLGISLFVAVLFCCVKIVKRQVDFRSLVLISACGILGLAVAQLATFYIVVALLGGLGVLAAWSLLRGFQRIETVRDFWNRRLTSQIHPLAIMAYAGLSLALSIPLLKYNYDIAYNTRGHTGFELFNQSNMAMLWAAFALLLPLYVLQWFFVFRRGDQPAYFFQISGLLGLLLGSGLTLTADNHYKGFYFLAIVLCISALLALQCLRNSTQKSWTFAGQVISSLLLILVFLRIIYVDYSLLRRASTNPYRGFAYEDEHIVHDADEQGRFPAFYWIRDNSPADALVITPLNGFIFESVLPERQFYVKKAQYSYTVNIDDYERRVRQLNKFYRDDTGPQDYYYISRNIARHFPDRPIYAVVKDSEVSPEVMAGRDAELVFEHEGDGANVYRLYPSADPPQQG